ncbi:MAG: ribosome small subunit-dependent GTPase A [Lachnospiraceae bacterium]|nr:ribosome small subunit-dependent GTPase A [Lachnospiraceae bacterium]
MTGKIIKGVAGTYSVDTGSTGVYECKARGVFRNMNIKPLVGDNVVIDVVEKENQIGNIIEVLDRKNELLRPQVSNVDGALVVFAVKDPLPNYNMLARFLILMDEQRIKTTICFNKSDIANAQEIEHLQSIYENSGYKVLFTSTHTGQGKDELFEIVDGKTIVLAGPSGVGKSSILNMLYPTVQVKTGQISEKIKRGKHTTRHSELFALSDNTYIMDTPGFTSLMINDIDENELKDYFSEFDPYIDECRFKGCVHISEPECAVKKAFKEGKISEIRYRNYIEIYNEIKSQRKY